MVKALAVFMVTALGWTLVVGGIWTGEVNQSIVGAILLLHAGQQ